VFHDLGLIFFLHGFLTRAITEPSPLGEDRPQCLMTPITKNTVEKKYFQWRFITKLVAIFTMITAKT